MNSKKCWFSFSLCEGNTHLTCVVHAGMHYLTTPGMVQKMPGDPSYPVSAIMLGLEILQGMDMTDPHVPL